ncbi:MAG: hypothetical protein CMO76_02570 [Verrucomicrobiales bacterium]|nr:hypothetical protein [Verrucomicrobiales bacterium]
MSLSPETVGIGSCAELTFEVQNNSGAEINDLSFTLNLPAGVVLSDPANPISDCGGTFDATDGGNTITLTGGSLGSNASCSARVGLTLLAEGPFSIISGDLTSDAGNSGNASVTIGIPSNGPALGFTKSFAESPVRLGGQTTLTYTIQNQSQTDAVGISFSDDLSPGIVVAGQPNIVNNCPDSTLTAIAGSQTVAFSGATLAASQTCIISLDIVGLVAGRNISVSNNISSSFPGGNSVPSGRACGTLQVIPPEDLADISFSKAFVEDTINPGGTTDLVFTLTNNSQTETFTEITFLDDLNAMLPGAVATNLPQEGGFIVNATFDGSGSSVLDSSWQYLDQLQNENGRNDDYPLDASGVGWTSTGFNTTTSNIGPWISGNAPFQAGVIDAFPPGTPAVLGGIDAADNGQNLVTTYLFRKNFTLNAEQANINNWSLDYVFDDGAIIYINGTEVFRSAGIPDGVITTTTLSGLGEETSRSSSQVDLSGILDEGPNTIAVELHQTTLDSSDAGFLLDLLPASSSPTAGFAFVDDTFEGTNDAGSADGTLNPNGGFSGGGIDVTIGGKNFITGFFNPASSGGWKKTFTVAEASSIEVSVRYRMVLDSSYEGDEFGQALLEIDGVRYGNSSSNSLSQLNGGAGVNQDTGWRVYTNSIFLAAGEHDIVLGAYNNQSNSGTEVTQVFFDDIQIGTPARPAAICGPNSQIAGRDVLSLTGGELAPGQSCSFRVGVSIPASAPFGDYKNRTSLISTVVGGRRLVGFPATDTLDVVPIPLAFSSSFSPSNISLNGTSTLTFSIDNQGSQAEATDVTFSATLPDGMALAADPEATSTCGGDLTAPAGGNTFNFSNGTIGAGEVCTVTVDVVGQTTGNLNMTSGNLLSTLGDSGTTSSTLSINPPPAFSMSFTPDEINAGQVSTLTLTIDNRASNAPATDLNLANELPDGLILANPSNARTTCQGGSLLAISGTDQFSYSGGTVPAGQICTFSVGITSSEGASYLNTTQKLTSSLGDSGTASDSLDVLPTVSLALNVTGSTPTVLAGSGRDNLGYVVIITNNGPSTATNIVIDFAETLPPGVIVENALAGLGTYDQSSWTIPALGTGGEATLGITYTVPQDTQAGTNSIVATATLTSVDQVNLNQANNSATETTSIVAGVDLIVTKTESDDPVIAGSGNGNLSYLIEVTNRGPLAATGLELTHIPSLGDGIPIESVTPSIGAFNNQTWTVGDLAVGATASLEISLTVGPSAEAASPGFTSTSSVSAVDQAQINTGDESVTSSRNITREVDLTILAESSRDPVLAGFNLPQNLFHTLTVTNQGPSDASGISLQLSEILPEGVTVDSINPANETIFADSIWSVGNLAAGNSYSIIYYFQVPGTVTGGADLISSQATVNSSNEPLLNPEDDANSITTDIVSPSNTEIAGEDIKLDFQTGLFKQVVIITNNNLGALPAFRVLVGGLPIGVTVANSQGDELGNSFLLFNQALESGESIELTVEYLQADASGGFEPTFEIELLDQVENQSAGEGVEVDRCEVLENGDVLIEFPSQIGATYTIQYSQNGEAWNNVVPDITAGGTRLQWIDNGPPKTISHPSGEKLRLYRVIKRDADQ